MADTSGTVSGLVSAGAGTDCANDNVLQRTASAELDLEAVVKSSASRLLRQDRLTQLHTR